MCLYFSEKKNWHYAFERTLYVQSQTRACVRTHLRLFERSALSHTHTHTLLYACVRTYPVRLSAEPTSLTHHQHECNRTHLRTIDRMRSEPSRDIFLGHYSSSPLISHRAIHFFPLTSPFSLLPNSLISKNPPPKHHSTTTAPPPRCHSTSAGRPIILISSFSSFSHLNPIIPKLLHFRPFLIIQGHNFTTNYAHLIAVLVLCDFTGGWGRF
jgi:hypothetical protein